MSSLLRLIAALLLVVVPAAVAAGCSSDAGVAGQSAEQVLRTTFGPDRPVTSGRLDVGLSLDGKSLTGAGGPVRLNLRGPFGASGSRRGIPAFAFDLVVGRAGKTVTAGAVSTGSAGFLAYGGRAYALDRRTWAELERGYVADRARSRRRGGRTLAALGVDPLRWLRDPEKVGEEDVGGVRTVHVRGRVDVRALLADVDRIVARAGTAVPGALTATQRRAMEAAVRSASVDIFTGRDGLLRRLNVQVALAAGRLGLDLRLAELNQPQEIRAPKDPRPLSELTGAGAPQGSVAPRPQGAGSPYARCLEEAAGDLARAQRCADLVQAP